MDNWVEGLIILGIPLLFLVLLHFAPDDGTEKFDTYF